MEPIKPDNIIKTEQPIKEESYEAATGQEEKELFQDTLLGISPAARQFHSTNFKEGQNGWRLNSNGHLEINGEPPSLSTDLGVAGTITFSSTYIYCCVAKDTWKRVAISTW